MLHVVGAGSSAVETLSALTETNTTNAEILLQPQAGPWQTT